MNAIYKDRKKQLHTVVKALIDCTHQHNAVEKGDTHIGVSDLADGGKFAIGLLSVCYRHPLHTRTRTHTHAHTHTHTHIHTHAHAYMHTRTLTYAYPPHTHTHTDTHTHVQIPAQCR